MKNNMKFLIIGVVVLVLLGAGIFLVAGNRNTGVPPQDSADSVQEGASTGDSIKSSLKELLAKGIPRKCTFTDTMEGVDTSGTMYFSGSKMRGDFSSKAEGNPMSSHMIYDNDTAYNWADGQTTGMMFKMNPDDAKEAREDVVQNRTFDPDKVVDYKCGPWMVDNSLFVPPSNVKFTDLSNMMAPTGLDTTGTGNGSIDMCAACANLEGEAKQQCLAALKCN